MLKKRYMIIGFLAFCLAATLFIGLITSGNRDAVSGASNIATTNPAEYDPWCDVDGSGQIRIRDIVLVALCFGTTGTPINKAALQTKGNISVPPAAFVPRDNETGYGISTSGLHNLGDTVAVFFASVQLPHGANITKFTIYWSDKGATPGIQCVLYRIELSTAATTNMLALLFSTAGAGYGSSYDDTIPYNPVDNNKYAYSIELGIASSASHFDYAFCGAQIEYKY